MVLNTDKKLSFQVTKPPYKLIFGSLEISSSYRFGGAMTLLVVDVRTYKKSEKLRRGKSDFLISVYNPDIGKLGIDP